MIKPPSDQAAPSRILPIRFFARPAEVVAPELIGAFLRYESSEGVVVVRIVETEAYGGGNDPGSHGYRGRTPRNEVMFGPPGRAYVYFTYGMHHCLNFVTDHDGTCSAVLVRAGEPVEGIELMRERRQKVALVDLASGPGKLTHALALGRDLNGISIVAGDLTVRSRGHDDPKIVVGERIGISRGQELPWRFAEADNPYVSRPRPRSG